MTYATTWLSFLLSQNVYKSWKVKFQCRVRDIYTTIQTDNSKKQYVGIEGEHMMCIICKGQANNCFAYSQTMWLPSSHYLQLVHVVKAHLYVLEFSITSMFIALLHIFLSKQLRLTSRYRIFSRTNSCNCWPSAVICCLIGFLSLWDTRIPHFHS